MLVYFVRTSSMLYAISSHDIVMPDTRVLLHKEDLYIHMLHMLFCRMET